jgi:XapX domain-containing protein
MKVYLISIGAGVLVGIVYSLLHVRSPAPPLVALAGLLGILIGEQAIPVGRQILSGELWRSASNRTEILDHLFGSLPGRYRHDATGRKEMERSS